MLRVLTCTLNGRASITLAGCAASGPRGQDSFNPESSVTTRSFRVPLPLGTFTNVDSVARKPGEHNSIHRCFASSYPRAHPLSRDAHPGYRIAARKIPCPFVDSLELFLLVLLGLFLFILLKRRRRRLLRGWDSRSFSCAWAVKTARKGTTTTKWDPSSNCARTIPTPADLLARITTCHRLFCLDDSGKDE